MRRNVSQAIDSIIEKKLNSGAALNNGVKDLYKYSKFLSSRKYAFHKYYFQFDNLLDGQPLGQRMDVYNNKFYNFYDNKIKKTQCKFNLLRLFKPGELLTSVAGIN
ncbi:MAG: hypothetical protein A2Y25_11710 [Candidatus Melainabacteria bacterium GWF2_37_15]|nr:MAG: hypothetical protein A2Y25_11710 [Candidatus Melainabacteria bacterium GWF2_37_15]